MANPRFTIFLAATGRPADASQFNRPIDRAFSSWMRDRWSEWRAENGIPEGTIASREDHASFDSWLAARYPEVSA